MNIQTAKYDIIQKIINLKDVELLIAIKQLLRQSPATSQKQMTLEEFYDRIAQSEKAFEEGDFISHEELKNEVQTWKSNH
jgi:hypothetical protein